ncbi:MAG: hypothetical protein V3R29_06975, partial [Candidatus Acidoferrales bacterium]
QTFGVALAGGVECLAGPGEFLFGFGAALGEKFKLEGELLQAEIHLLQFNQTFEVWQHSLVQRWLSSVRP